MKSVILKAWRLKFTPIGYGASPLSQIPSKNGMFCLRTIEKGCSAAH